jgi:uncharacterized membrane protein YfcA
MDLRVVILLSCAGVGGGLINAIAGGATLITFPAMVAAGLPAIVANASNAVAVTPGHAVAAFADRSRLPPLDRRLGMLVGSAAAASATGAFLLIVTPERLFTLLVPALVGIGTVAYALGPKIGMLSERRARGLNWHRSRILLLTGTSVYGGYFGAGLGVMLLAALSVTGDEDVRSANALKNMLATGVSTAGIIVFIARGSVRWPETLVMLAGAAVGGFAGGRLLGILPSGVVRILVIAVGTAMTVAYAKIYWLD